MQSNANKNMIFYSEGSHKLWQLKRLLAHAEKAGGDNQSALIKLLYDEFHSTLDDQQASWRELNVSSDEP